MSRGSPPGDPGSIRRNLRTRLSATREALGDRQMARLDRVPRPVLLALVQGSWCVIALLMVWFVAAVTGHRVTDDLARSRVSHYLTDDEARREN